MQFGHLLALLHDALVLNEAELQLGTHVGAQALQLGDERSEPHHLRLGAAEIVNVHPLAEQFHRLTLVEEGEVV